MNNASSSSIVTATGCFAVGLKGEILVDGPGEDGTAARGRGRGRGRGLDASVDIVEKQP